MGRLLVLGTPEVVVSGVPRTVAGVRRQSLLGVLVARRDTDVSVDLLIDRLWTNLEPSSARRALRSEVHRLREMLSGCATLETRPGAYRLVVDALDLDVARFEALAGQASSVLAIHPVEACRLAESALLLWRGRPYGELVELEELSVEQTRLEELRGDLLAGRAEAWLALGGRLPELIAELLSLTALWPLRERLWAMLMTAYWRAGRQADALDAYQRARALMVEELGVEPSAELRRVEAAVLAQDTAVLGVVEPRVTPLSLSHQRSGSTGLIGRAASLDSLSAALSVLRLITLVGPGGIGKTRLADELLARATARFPDGCHFVDLSTLSNPAGLAAVVAAMLGVSELADVAPQDALAQALLDQSILLVIDNCEHVIDAAAALIDRLIRGTRRIAIVATSRAPLGLAIEQVWPVEPLDARTEGVELFCARAHAADVTFQASDDERAVIGELCARLDGLPLAIELAASRVRAFGATAVAQQLTSAELLDVSSGRDRPERHRSLRRAMGWSYDLLTPSERALFDAASVFVSSFDLASIAVVGGLDGDLARAAELVTALINKAMLVRVDSGGAPRFAMLETLRQFAAEQLDGRQETDQRRWAHAAHFTTVAEAARRQTWSADEPHAWAAITENWPNTRLAFQTAVQTKDCELIGRLCKALAFYGLFAGNSELGVWARDAVEAGILNGHPSEAAARGAWGIHAYWILGDLAETGRAVGDWSRLRDAAGNAPFHLAAFMRAQAVGGGVLANEISRAWSEQPGEDADSMVLAPAVRSYYALWLQDPRVDAAEWCERALKLAVRSRAPTLLSYVLVLKAQIVGVDRPSDAIELTERAVDVLEPLPVVGWIAIAPLGYRMAALVLGSERHIAVAATVEVLERSRSQRFRQGARMGLWAAAVCLAHAGRAEEGLALARRSGAHVGRSSLGLNRELDRLYGDGWHGTLDGHAAEHSSELLDAVDAAIDALTSL
ncbi:MAG: BTAD domain-containing putative transcriptional regulator [Acidimicrobiales bacterium]